MKKINSNTQFLSLVLNAQDDKTRYAEEKYKSLTAKSTNWTEDKLVHNVGGGMSRYEIKSALNAIFHWGIGKWVVQDHFHFYADRSEVMLTGSLGLVRSNLPAITQALRNGMRFVDLHVPGIGTVTFKLPTSRKDGQTVVEVTSPWLAMKVTGLDDGKLSNTDTNEKYDTHTTNYHNVISSLANGNPVTVMVTMSHNKLTGELYRDNHDLAEKIFTILTSKDLNPEKEREALKEEAKEYHQVRSDKFSGKVQEFNAVRANVTLELSNVVASVDGTEMDCLQVPTGVYVMATAKGKTFGKEYSVQSVSDRLGLSRRPDAETGKVYLVRVR